MIERRSSSVPVNLESREDGQPGKIRGIAAVYYRDGDPGTEFALWRGAVERIMPGAFASAISRDDVRGLYNHDPNHVLGRTKAGTMVLRDDADGLHYAIEPSNTSIYRDVAEHLKRGDIDGSSFAFRVVREEWRSDGSDGEIREIHEVELFDVGPVTYPAYAGTEAGFRSSSGVDEARKSHAEWVRKRQAKRDLAKSQQDIAANFVKFARRVLTDNG